MNVKGHYRIGHQKINKTLVNVDYLKMTIDYCPFPYLVFW